MVHTKETRELHDAVVGREVVSPKERLLAQLDTGREETEDSDKDGELQQSGQATRCRTHTGLTLQVQHCLLLLHGILLLGVFRVDGFRLVGLECQGEQQRLDEDGQNENDDTVIPAVTAQPVEDGNDAVVDPTDQEEVTQVDLVLHADAIAP